MPASSSSTMMMASTIHWLVLTASSVSAAALKAPSVEPAQAKSPAREMMSMSTVEILALSTSTS